MGYLNSHSLAAMYVDHSSFIAMKSMLRVQKILFNMTSKLIYAVYVIMIATDNGCYIWFVSVNET